MIRKKWFGAIVAGLAAAAAASGDINAASSAGRNAYVVTELVSDQKALVGPPDTNLVNAWGLTSLATSPWWVADNGANVSTLYTAAGVKVALTVNVNNAPTGAVSNASTTSFKVSKGMTAAPARFIFATEEGTILGWNPTVSPDAVLAVDHSGSGAVYKGLALASTAAGDFLFATDFHNDKVDVFDSNFQPVTTTGGFEDRHIHKGFAPFGIQNVKGSIVVTYAKQDKDKHDDVAGQGHGFVDMFDTNGVLVTRIAQHGQLNSPWGIAMAPAGFGAFSGDLLIGNFGDGQINAFEPKHNGKFEFAGQMRGADHKVLVIEGLWALQFGKGATNNGPVTTLFFTAGTDG